MVDADGLRWQNTTIRADSSFCGVFGLGLLLAWFFFVWLLLQQPGFAQGAAKLPALLRFALDKGYYATDLGMILLGFVAFHAQRDLRLGWKTPVAIRMYLRMLIPLAAYLVLSLVLFELACSLSGAGFVNPWTSPAYGLVFRAMVVIVVGLVLAPLVICWSWAGIIDQIYTFLLLALCFYGVCFYFGVRHVEWLWAWHLPVAFFLGITICSMFFRGVQYPFLTSIRGHMALLGWFALIGGSILGGPFLFYLGFVMILTGAALVERMNPLAGEAGFLAWARTALGIMLAAPAVLVGWHAVGPGSGLPVWVQALILAVLTQLLGMVLYGLAEPTLAAVQRRRAIAGST